MDGFGLKERIVDNISYVLESQSFELVDVELKKQRGKNFVVIYVDKKGGVDVQDCAELSEVIGEILDVEDILPYPYTLEVSSPGLDRPLVTPRDFERNKGKRIYLFHKDYNGKELKGIIHQVNPDGIQLATDGGMVAVPFSKIIEAKNQIDIDNVN